MANEPVEQDPQKVKDYKVRQYDIVLNLISWLISEHRRGGDYHAILPLINGLGMWWDTQAERGLVQPKHKEL